MGDLKAALDHEVLTAIDKLDRLTPGDICQCA